MTDAQRRARPALATLGVQLTFGRRSGAGFPEVMVMADRGRAEAGQRFFVPGNGAAAAAAAAAVPQSPLSPRRIRSESSMHHFPAAEHVDAPAGYVRDDGLVRFQ